jgi:hypothetical protein
MSVRYATNSLASLGRGPKSSLPFPWFRRRASALNTSYAFTSLSLGATANTKTAWTQVFASTSAAVGGIKVISRGAYTLTSAQSAITDIGIGAAGSETVIVPNLLTGAPANHFGGISFDIPVSIPAGSRIAIRASSQRVSYVLPVLVILFPATDPATTPTSVDTLGIATATSSGMSMTGASGTYTQIIASTARDYQALIIVPGPSSNSAYPGLAPIFTCAVGAAGAERDVTQSATNSDAGLGFGNFPLSGERGGGLVPAGSRISVKHNIASTPGNFSASVIGIPYV